MKGIGKPYDVFISYVVEDRKVVEELYESLTAKGLKVWYAKNELFPGGEIRQIIQEGLGQSRYGVPIISRSYRSHWAYGELFYLMNNKKAMIPVLHGISVEEVAKDIPEIITVQCLNTDAGIESAASKLIKHIGIRSQINYAVASMVGKLKYRKNALSYSGLILLVLFGVSLFISNSHSSQPDIELIEKEIAFRISEIEKLAQQKIQYDIGLNNAHKSSIDAYTVGEAQIEENSKYYRNKFDLSDGQFHINTFKELEAIDFFSDDRSSKFPYGMTQYSIYQLESRPSEGIEIGFSAVNLLPLVYKIRHSETKDGYYEVRVEYEQGLRYAQLIISLDKNKETRYYRHNLCGIKPTETYVFHFDGDKWGLQVIK